MQKSSEKMRQKIGSACISLQTRSNRNCRIFSEAFIFTFFQCLAYSLLLLRRKSLGKKSCSGIGLQTRHKGDYRIFQASFIITFFQCLVQPPGRKAGGLAPHFFAPSSQILKNQRFLGHSKPLVFNEPGLKFIKFLDWVPNP